MKRSPWEFSHRKGLDPHGPEAPPPKLMAPRAGLNEAAGPAAHLVALAHAVGLALQRRGIHAHALVMLAVFRQQVPRHIGVGRKVAGAQDDALAGHVLSVAVGTLGDDAGHCTALILGEHRGLLAAVPRDAEVLALQNGELLELVQTRQGSHAVHGRMLDRAHELHHAGPGLEAAAIQRIVHRAIQGKAALVNADHAVIEGADGRVGLAHQLDAIVGPVHQRGCMVEHLAGIRHELANNLGVHTTTGAQAELLHDLALVIGPEPALDEELGIHMADVLALHLATVLGRLLDDSHLRAALGCG